MPSPVAVAVCGTDVGHLVASWRAISARRDWCGWTGEDLPLALVTGRDQYAAVTGLCPQAQVVVTGQTGWPAITTVAQSWAGDRPLVAVRAGALPDLTPQFRSTATGLNQITVGCPDGPGTVDLMLLPPGRRLHLNARTRGCLSEQDVAEVLAASGANTNLHSGLRYSRFAVRGPAFATTDWVARVRNSVVRDPRATVADDFAEVAARARRERESPFWYYDAIIAIDRAAGADGVTSRLGDNPGTFDSTGHADRTDGHPEPWLAVAHRAAALGFAERLEWFSSADHLGYPAATAYPAATVRPAASGHPAASSYPAAIDHPAAAAAIGYRHVVQDASRRGLATVLVLSDDVVFRRGTRAILTEVNGSLAQLDSGPRADWGSNPDQVSKPVATPTASGDRASGGRASGGGPAPGDRTVWDVCCLGGDVPDLGDDVLPAVPGHPRLRRIDRAITSVPAQVVRASAFELLLDELPRTVADAEQWCERWTDIDRYLSEQFQSGRLHGLVIWPRVAARSQRLTSGDEPMHPDELAAFVV
ncbi:MAG: hypothetical protein ACRC35_11900 [Angustibacter sp.]